MTDEAATDTPAPRQWTRDYEALRGQLDAWLQLMSIGRHLERIADHATAIAQTVVYLEEGVIVRHKTETPPSTD